MIRRATQDDAAALAALWNPWITDTAITFAATAKTPADMAHMIATRPAFFTTHDLQGFATYGQFRSGDGYATCMEHSIILGPNARGQGLGALLLHAVESHARAHGAHQMIAAISGENPAAIRFHARQGYRQTAVIEQAGRKFDRFIHLVLMQKFLT